MIRPALLLPLALAAALGGCATVTRGTTEPVQFVSEPPGAAVTTSIGLSCPATPCTMIVRRQDAFTATFELPGHKRAMVPVATVMQGGGTAGVVGNVLLGGVVGAVVDSTNGSTLDHLPNPVAATLEPLAPARSTPRRPRGRAPAGES